MTLLVGLSGAPPGVLGQDAGYPDGLDVVVREELHAIEAPTFAELVRTLNAMSLEGEGAPLSQGLTVYRILPEWRLVPGGGTCRVADVRVRVRVTVTLPEWTAAGDAAEDERARWEEIHRRIRDHEYTHRDLTIEAGAALLGSLEALRPAPCRQLRAAVEGEIRLADQRLGARHAELDRNP